MERFDHAAPRPLAPREAQDGSTLTRLVQVMQRLLGPGGCPWDREQSYATLKQYVLEEACEVLDAIDSGDRAHLREELGDLLLQVVFQAELAREEGSFAIDDVVEGIVAKLVRRHPHVFGDGQVGSAAEVRATWDALKAKEKADRRLLDGVPRNLPALLRATKIGNKVKKVGFDWESPEGSRAKVTEELAELDQAHAEGDRDAMEAELGDVLFALVNYARHLNLDPEKALQRTSDKFTRRFSHVENRVRENHGGFEPKQSLAVLDGYWEEAKQQERAS